MMGGSRVHSLKSRLGGVWGQGLCVLPISVQGDFEQPLPGSQPVTLGAD